MAKVKIILDSGESIQEAEDSLVKAITSHDRGEAHTDGFEDPAMQSVVNRMEEIHKKLYQEMLAEINEALDKEYSKNGY